MPNSAAAVGRSRLSAAQEDYLKALHQLAASGRGVSTSELAEQLHVSPPSVSEMLVKLAGLGLVTHDRYRSAMLTEAGRAVAVEMVRHHRLLEMYLVEALGYGWDEVHEEAERLEHAISELLEQRIAAVLGEPSSDPHGDPIPSADGRVADSSVKTLLSCPAGSRMKVSRVSDRDAGKLRAIADLGLRPGTSLEVVVESRYEGPIEVRAHGRRMQVPLGLARAVFVE